MSVHDPTLNSFLPHERKLMDRKPRREAWRMSWLLQRLELVGREESLDMRKYLKSIEAFKQQWWTYERMRTRKELHAYA